MRGYASTSDGDGSAASLTGLSVCAIAFTDHGMQTGERMRAVAPQMQLTRCPKGGLAEWTAGSFESADVIIYIGAAGIAVRAIAPHIVSKLCDPAVLVTDELGRYVIPILSGHVGGANAAAEQIAGALGATAVITTATDLNHRFAIDVWAVRQGLTILNKDGIKTISSRILAEKPVYIYSRWDIGGELPDGVQMTRDPARAHAIISYRDEKPRTSGECAANSLRLTPRCLYIGIGCRRGTPRETIEAAWSHIADTYGLYAEAVAGVTSIDIKADEPGLLAFCKAHGWTLMTYTADELNAVAGDFHGSDFVKRTVGVDSVCERSCVLAARNADAGGACRRSIKADDTEDIDDADDTGYTDERRTGTADAGGAKSQQTGTAAEHMIHAALLVPKTAADGVTVAVALAPPRLRQMF